MCQRGCPTPQPVPVSASSAALYRVRLEPGWRSEYAGIEYAALPVNYAQVSRSDRYPDIRCPHAVATFVQIDRVEFVAGFPDTPADPAVVVVNPDDEITPESFAAWLDRRQAGEPVDPGVRAADSLAEARAAGEV